MNRGFLLGLAVFLIVFPLSARGEMYTVYVDQDSWLKQSAPDENHGSDVELSCKSTPADSFRAVFRYDLSSIPAGETVLKAMVVFYISAPDISGNPVHIHRVTDAWTEGGVTWANTADDYDDTIQYGSFSPAVLGFVAVDITQLVREWVEGIHPNEGLMFIASSFDVESKYASKEWQVPNERPSLMILTNDGPMLMARGSYVGNGTPGSPISGLGFQPDLVIVQGGTLLPAVARTSTMFGDVSKKLGAADPLINNAIFSLDFDGFTLGSDAHVNSPGINYYWMAYRASAGEMVVSSYLGNGFDNQSIPGVGFEPDFVIIMNESAVEAVHRFSSQTGDATFEFGFSGESTNRIQAFEPDGFQVGSDSTVNEPGAFHHYVAWKSTAGRINGNTYTGTGFDNENILGVGFQPEYLIIKSQANIAGAVHRSESFPGDATLPVEQGLMLDDAIQTFLPDGFQLGMYFGVNTFSEPYHWMAFRSSPILDIALTKDVDLSNPCEGDTITYRITVDNDGPADATGVEILDPLPAGVTYISDSPSQGAYSSASGRWSVGDLANGANAYLYLEATIDEGTGGSSIINTAAVLAVDQSDTTNGNDMASIGITVQNTDFRVKTGSYVGDGSNNRSIPNPGFRPDLVIVKGDNNEPSVARSSTMVGDVSKELGTNAPFLGNLITSLDAYGFTIGTGTQVNDPGITYYWTAFQAAPNYMSVGSYTGDHNDDRSITGVGFEPDYVIVLAAVGEHAMQRFRSEADDKSIQFDDSDEKGDRIQAFEVDGFQIGTHGTVNKENETYHYVAWNIAPGRINENNYYGNESDNFNIRSVYFRPDYLIITRKKGGSPAIHRPGSLEGDNTLPVDPGETFSNGIQMLIPDGFQIGTEDAVNKSTEQYCWVAFRDVTSLDLALSKTVSDSFPNEEDTLTYTIRLFNNGPDDATEVEVTDILPEGVTYVSHSKSQGSYSEGSGLWDVGDVDMGETDSLVISVIVDNGAAGANILNVANITGADQADSDGSNDSDSASVTVQSADLSISKIVDLPTPNVGDTINYTVTLENNGPDAATNVEVLDLLPAGLLYLSDSTSAGSYASGTGFWSIGTVTTGDSTVLMINALVDAGISDSTVTNSATVTSVDQADPDSSNNTDTVGIDVSGTDLAIEKIVDIAMPFEGDTLTFTMTLANLGPDAATGVEVTDLLPDGLTYSSDTTSHGAYVSATGLWTVGGLVFPDTATLRLLATVDSGTVDSVITNTASLAAIDQRDLDSANNCDSVNVTVVVAPLIQDSPGSLYPSSAYTEAPQLALRIGVNNSTVVGAMLDTTSAISFSDGAKVFLAKLANPTYVPPLASNFTVTFRPAAVPAGIAAPASYDLTLFLTGVDDNAKAYNDTVSTSGRNSITIDVPRVAIGAHALDVETVRPGVKQQTLLALEFENPYPDTRALDTLIVTNMSVGPGSQMDLDTEMDSLFIYDDVDSSGTFSGPDTLESTSSFVAGRATFSIGGDWGIPAGVSRSLLIVTDVDSSLAKDGDRLDAALASPYDVLFTDSTHIEDTFSPLDPVDSFGYLVIDGMVGHQISLAASPQDTLASGTDDVLLLTAVFPQNGYAPDTLTALAIIDLAGDFSPDDFNALHLYQDNGDTFFDPDVDSDLGELIYSGDRFEISGVSAPVGPSERFFISADVSTTPNNGDHFRPAIPLGGIDVVSQNDGPIDSPVAIDTLFTIRRIEKIEVEIWPVPSTFPRPGDEDVSLLLASIKNNTIQSVTLDSLALTNTSVGPRTPAELDGEISELKIFLDDGNGVVDGWDQLLSDSLFFSNGSLVARGIDRTMSPGELDYLLFACDIDSFCSRDGDTLRLKIPSTGSLYFDPVKPVVGDLLLETAGAVIINGMIACQIDAFPATDSLVIAETTDVLVFDFSIPANGYDTDTLESIEIFNQGSATSEHFARLALYADGGNGTFDSGAGDDTILGDFFEIGGKDYLLPGLNVPLLGICGFNTRLFVAADLHATFTNGASIQFEIPLNGIEVASGNDGPIDAPVMDPSLRLIPKPNELTVFPYSVGDKRVRPGTETELNFGVGFYNGYSSSFDVDKIKLSLSHKSTALSDEIDAIFAYEDSDTNGLFDSSSDQLLSTGYYENLQYVFDDVGLALASKRVSYLFIAYDLSSTTRDSVGFDLELCSYDLTLSSGSIEIIGEFPINSPGVDYSDGMIAAQIILNPVPKYRTAPGDEDVLALAPTIPSNGALSDVLRSIAIQNSGTAVAGGDITILKLWKESGGDPLTFNALEDQFVSFLPWNGTAWQNTVELAEVIPVPGLRCYITFSVSNAASDGANFRSKIPICGIQVDSGNDGPLDTEVENPYEQTISTDPLLTSLYTDRSTYSIGQAILLSMKVRNTGTIPISNISPSAISLSGDGSAVYQSGPSIDSFSLSSQSDTTVLWTYVSTDAGDVSFCGFAYGNDSTEISEGGCADGVELQNKPVDISIALADLAPPGANRGQDNVRLFKLQCNHGAPDSLSANVLFSKISVGFENELGVPIPPANLLETFTLANPGGSHRSYILVDSISNPTTLSIIPPISIAPGDSLILDASCQVSDSASLGVFRTSMQSLADIHLLDSNDSSVVTLFSQTSFPWHTNEIAINAPAETLFVSVSDLDTVLVNYAQEDVVVFGLRLLNGGSPSAAGELLTEITYHFYDALGAPISPNTVIRKISLISNEDVVFIDETIPATGNQYICHLENPLVLQPGNEKPLDVILDLKAFPQTDGFYLTVSGPLSIKARDFNTGHLIEVVPGEGAFSFPLKSPVILFQSPASGVDISHTSTLAQTLLPSMQSVPVMDIVLTHLDTYTASSLELDSLTVVFTEADGTPLFPGGYFSSLLLKHGSDTLFIDFSLSNTLPLAEIKINPPFVISAAASETLQILLDTKSLYTPATFKMRIEKDYFMLLDSNDHSRIHAITGAFPLESDPATLRVPSSTALCGMVSTLPGNICAKQNGVRVFDLILGNGNPEGSTNISVRSVTVKMESIRGQRLDPTGFLSGAYLSGVDSVISVGQVSSSGISFDIDVGFVEIAAGLMDTLLFTVDVNTQSAGENIRFIIEDSASVEARDAVTDNGIPTGTLYGTGYPLSSSATHILGTSAREAFTNYPNPFAAGREETRITFYLSQQSRVTMKLYTIWGKPVITLVSNKLFNPGLQQDVLWNGKNSDGEIVNNGVYYLVLEIKAVDGKQSTMKRKVGVVR